MAFLLALLFFASIAQAAVDGTVMNGTTGKAQAGATVTLYRVGQNGPESIESVKSGPDGAFKIEKDGLDPARPGPRLLQAAFDGVTYNKMLPPGLPSQNVTIEVYAALNRPGKAKVDQHIILFEPANGQMTISESFVYQNDGSTTYNDPDRGTLRFMLPPAANGQVQMNVLAPQGMPIRRAPEKTSTPNVYKVDFPIKPGESRIDLTYSIPFQTPGAYPVRMLYQGGPTRIVVPTGVTVKAPGLENLGQEPRTQAAIYGTNATDFELQIDGSGSLNRSDDSGGGDSSGQSLSQIMPKLYQSADPTAGFWDAVNSVKWILMVAFAILALGFVLLYRARAPEAK